jgi:predicted nucleotidyltransferase
MPFDIGKYLGQLREFCEQYGVVRLDLFGSAVRDDFNEEHSDPDFLVTFDEPPKMGYADRYFGLLEDLQKLFNRKVDLVEEKAIKNPYFRRVVNRERKLCLCAMRI